MATTTDPLTCLTQLQNSSLLCPDRCGTPMYRETYDPDGDGCVEGADKICGIEAQPANRYYGTGPNASAGFWPLTGGAPPGATLAYPVVFVDANTVTQPYDLSWGFQFQIYTRGVPFNVRLPAIGATDVDKSLIIQDYEGLVRRDRPITITPQGSTIMGGSSWDLKTKFESAMFYAASATEVTVPLNHLRADHVHVADIDIEQFKVWGRQTGGNWGTEFLRGTQLTELFAGGNTSPDTPSLCKWKYNFDDDVPPGDPEYQAVSGVFGGEISNLTVRQLNISTAPITTTQTYDLTAARSGVYVTERSSIVFKDALIYGITDKTDMTQVSQTDFDDLEIQNNKLSSQLSYVSFNITNNTGTPSYWAWAIPVSWGLPVAIKMAGLQVNDTQNVIGNYQNAANLTVAYRYFRHPTQNTEPSINVELLF